MSKQTVCIFWKGSWKARAFWYQRGKICSPFYLQVFEVRSEDLRKFSMTVTSEFTKSMQSWLPGFMMMSLSDFGLLQTGMCRNLSQVWRKQSAGARATTSFCNLISKNGSTWCFGMAMMHRDIPHSSFALDLPTPSLWLLTVLDSHKQLVCILIFASWMVGRWRINFSIRKCTKYDFIPILQMATSEVLRLILAKTCNMHLLIKQQWQ